MSTKQFKLAWFTSIVLGCGVAAMMPGVQAHVDENNPNHAHVCTANDPLIVRESFSRDSKNIGSLSKGTIVDVIGTYYPATDNYEEPAVGWIHIEYKNTSGFINSGFVCY